MPQVAEPAAPRADAVIPGPHMAVSTHHVNRWESRSKSRGRRINSHAVPRCRADPGTKRSLALEDAAPDPIRMAPVVLEARITPKVEAKAVADPAIRTPDVSAV